MLRTKFDTHATQNETFILPSPATGRTDLGGEVDTTLLQAGFTELRVTRTSTYEVWAIAFMPEADTKSILDKLAATGIELRD